MDGMGIGRGRGWALITVEENFREEAFRKVLDLAMEWQWRNRYQIKRVDVVRRVTDQGSAYGLFVAVKTDSEDQLRDAFQQILRRLRHNQPPSVDGYRTENSIEIDW